MTRIIIDNGHGIDTKGKRSPVWPDGSQLLEWEFNRDIANRLKEQLKVTGCLYGKPETETVVTSFSIQQIMSL